MLMLYLFSMYAVNVQVVKSGIKWCMWTRTTYHTHKTYKKGECFYTFPSLCH